jgi:hypothetical protein
MTYSFWDIVEEVKKQSSDDWESRPENLKQVLMAQGIESIQQFHKDYYKKLSEAYRWDLWGAAYLINGGCSDDGFDYFLDFLISEGKEVYEAALKSPDSLADLDDIEGAELGSYRYAINEAYEELANEEITDDDIEYHARPSGEEWDEDDLDAMFPRLAEKYC